MSASNWTRAGVAIAAVVGCTSPAEPTDTGDASTSSSSSSTASAEPSSSGSTSDTGSIQTVTSATTTGEETTAVDMCSGPIASLAAMIEAGEPCEILVHLDDGAAPRGFAVTCGATGTTWELTKEIGVMTHCCADGPKTYPAGEGAPLYVLHLVTFEGPDGVALLSNHTGRVLLDAMTGADGPGVFMVPAAWSDASLLAAGMGCGDPGFSLENALSYDLGQGGGPLDEIQLAALATAIGDTALVPALAHASTPVHAAVLRYAPEDGGPAHDFVLLAVNGTGRSG